MSSDDAGGLLRQVLRSPSPASIARFPGTFIRERKIQHLRRIVLPDNALHQIIAAMLSLAPCRSYYAVSLVCKRWRKALCGGISSYELLRFMIACMLCCDERHLANVVKDGKMLFKEYSADNVFTQLRKNPRAVGPWLELLGLVQRSCRVTGRFVVNGNCESQHPVSAHVCIDGCVCGWLM